MNPRIGVSRGLVRASYCRDLHNKWNKVVGSSRQKFYGGYTGTLPAIRCSGLPLRSLGPTVP